MGRYTKERPFRCPECWRGYNTDTALASHRQRSQGECIRFSRHKPTAIAAYRIKRNIAKLQPLPAPQV